MITEERFLIDLYDELMSHHRGSIQANIGEMLDDCVRWRCRGSTTKAKKLIADLLKSHEKIETPTTEDEESFKVLQDVFNKIVDFQKEPYFMGDGSVEI